MRQTIVKEVKKNRWKEVGERKRGGTKEAQRLLKSSFLLLQSICGAFLLERFWWARSLACCSDMFRDSPASSLEAFTFGFSCKCFMIKTNILHSFRLLKTVCTDTNLWCWGAGRSCRRGGVGGGAGGRQTHSYFRLFFLGCFSIHLPKKHWHWYKNNWEHKRKHFCISFFCWTQKYIFWRMLRTMQANENLHPSSKYLLCLPQKKVCLERHEGE